MTLVSDSWRDAEEVLLHGFGQGPDPAPGIYLTRRLEPPAICWLLYQQGPGQVKLLQGPASQIPYRAVDFRLALRDEISRHFQMLLGVLGLLFKQFRGVSNCKRLPVEPAPRCRAVLGQARSLRQSGLGLKFNSLRAVIWSFICAVLSDSFLQLIVRCPQLEAGLLFFPYENFNVGVLFRNHHRPTHCHNGNGQQNCQAGQEPLWGQPAWLGQDAGLFVRGHENLKRPRFPVFAALRKTDPADFDVLPKGRSAKSAMASGASVSAVKVKFSLCNHQDRPFPYFPGCRLAIPLTKTSSNLPFNVDQFRVAQTVFDVVHRYGLGESGTMGLGCLSKNRILQHRQEVLEIRKSHRLNYIAHGKASPCRLLTHKPPV